MRMESAPAQGEFSRRPRVGSAAIIGPSCLVLGEVRQTMRKPLAFVVFASIVVALAISSSPLPAQVGGKDKSTGKDTAKDSGKGKDKDTGKPKDKEKVDPATLKPDAAVVKAQREKAEQYFKEVFEVDKVPHHESAHLLLFGQ